MLHKLLGAVDKLNDWAGKVFSYGLLVIGCIMAYDVVARYVFHNPTKWGWTINGLLFSAIVFLGLGYVHLKGGHVRLELLYERFGPRGKLIADIATFPVFLVFLSTVLWWGCIMASSSLAIQEHSKTFPAPVWPVKIAFVIGVALLLLQGIATFIRNIISLKESIHRV
jgi:TRAP-type mannitol/chloroaromatic compound transport system permease small subunit